MNKFYNHFIEGFEKSLASRNSSERRIGAELKFPLVNRDGTAASHNSVRALWDYLVWRGWTPVENKITSQVIGAKKPGQQNDIVARCETGFCKPEFSLAHVANLFDLEKQINELRTELRPFCEENQVYFLGYGIQPVTPPNKNLMMKNERTSPWVRVDSSDKHLQRKDGEDVYLFTINAASHVHVSVSLEEAVDAVNVLNGFSGAQIALTANSNIWRGRADPQYKCVGQKLWDWWMPDSDRVGIPHKPFRDIEDYVHTIANFKPLYVLRNGRPIILKRYRTFDEYYRVGRAVGIDIQGRDVSFVPEGSDIGLHNSCYWYDARISRYYTVENRVNDQQPPDELMCVPALTVGLVSALPEATKSVFQYDWERLRQIREVACSNGLSEGVGEIYHSKLALQMWLTAYQGLIRRGLGEEKFLEPLEQRLSSSRCPADQARQIFQDGGIEALLKMLKL